MPVRIPCRSVELRSIELAIKTGVYRVYMYAAAVPVIIRYIYHHMQLILVGSNTSSCCGGIVLEVITRKRLRKIFIIHCVPPKVTAVQDRQHLVLVDATVAEV